MGRRLRRREDPVKSIPQPVASDLTEETRGGMVCRRFGWRVCQLRAARGAMFRPTLSMIGPRGGNRGCLEFRECKETGLAPVASPG